MEDIGGLVVELLTNAARAKQAQQRGEPVPPPREIVRRFLVGQTPGGAPAGAPRAGAPAQPTVGAQARAESAARSAEAPPPAAPLQPHQPVHASPLLADFQSGRRFL